MLNTKMIGNKIAEARKKTNLSQAQLAERLFISPQAVGKWERGESMPDITTFNRLSEILGVDLNYFSEHIQTQATEPASPDPLIKQSDELLFKKPEKRPSWDMSLGNWVDADFSGLRNLHEKFSSSNMQRCKFIGSNLSGLLLKTNNVDSCDFSNSDISSSQIQTSNLANNIFRNCLLKETGFSKSHIKDCDFSGSNFTGTDFKKSNYLESCDFSNADIANSHVQGSSFANNIFKNCSLKETEFSESHVNGCDFSDADFTGVTFKSGAFVNNTMANAVWNRTSFIGMQIDDVVFNGTLEDCYFENCTFKRVTFQNSTLINTFFKNNSLFKSRGFKGLQFIDCETDRITYEFLKSGKADVTGIKLLTS
jgi:uncharacterized protein YjbI with pentapeptide repeats